MRLVQTLLPKQCKRLGLFAAAVLVASLATSVLGVGTVQAAPPTAPQRAFARELYANGQQLFRQGDFAAAQRAFEEAYRVVPNPVVLLSIAECQTRSEQYAAAIESFKLYLKERDNAPDKAEVEAQIQALSAKPATLTVESSIPGAAISVDGGDTGRVTPADLELAGGDHVIGLLHEGYVGAEQTISLPPGGKERVAFSLTPAPPVPVAAPVEQPVVEEPEKGRHAGTAVWVATGVAGAGLVTGIILGSVALKKHGDYNRKATESLVDSGERMNLFADVGFGIAVAAGITAVVLYLTSDTKKGEQQAWSVDPAVASGRAGLVGRLRF